MKVSREIAIVSLAGLLGLLTGLLTTLGLQGQANFGFQGWGYASLVNGSSAEYWGSGNWSLIKGHGLGYSSSTLYGLVNGSSLTYTSLGNLGLIPAIRGSTYNISYMASIVSGIGTGLASSWSLSYERDPPVIVVRGLNGKLYKGVYMHGYLEWSQLPGASPDHADAARCRGLVYITVRGLQSQIFVGYLNASTLKFSGWVRVPGATPSAPAIAAEPDCSRIYIVVRGVNNLIYYTYLYPNLTWIGEWYRIPGATDASPSAAVLNGTLYIAVKGYNNKYLFLWVGDRWVKLPGASDQPPDIASNGTHLALIVKGLDNRLYIGYWNGSFNGWHRIPGLTTCRPSIAYTSNWYLGVIGLNNKIFIKHLDDKTWNMLSGSTQSPIAIG